MNQATERSGGADGRPAPLGPVGGTVVPRFAGASTFVRLPAIEEVTSYDIGIFGVPFDAGTSFRPGARFGPLAVRIASRNLRPAYHQELGTAPFQAVQVVDAGDVPLTPFDIEAAIGQIDDYARDALGSRARLVSVGGDHTIALGTLRAVHGRHGPVALVRFDAHLDAWDTYFGAAYTHGTVFRRAFEEGLLVRDHSVHVGIRGPLYSAKGLDDDLSFGFQIVRATDLESMELPGVVELVGRRVGDLPVYLSVDIDVLHPAFAPGTGTPEVGGLSSRELLSLLRGLDGLAIVAADVVAVAPAYGHAEIAALAAATVVFDMVTLMASSGI